MHWKEQEVQMEGGDPKAKLAVVQVDAPLWHYCKPSKQEQLCHFYSSTIDASVKDC